MIPESGYVNASLIVESLRVDARYEDGSVANWNAGNKDYALEEQVDVIDFLNELEEEGKIEEGDSEILGRIIGFPQIEGDLHILKVVFQTSVKHYLIWVLPD